MSRLTRDGTAEPVSRDQILRRERGQGNIHFPCSADHQPGWQPYPVDPYSAICHDRTYYTYHRIDDHFILMPFFSRSTQKIGSNTDFPVSFRRFGAKSINISRFYTNFPVSRRFVRIKNQSAISTRAQRAHQNVLKKMCLPQR